MGKVTLYSGSSGLNTVLDPESLSQGTSNNPGIIELAQAVNVSINERGLCSLRYGNALLQAGTFHSIFCKGGDCFVVRENESDASIMQVVSVSPLTLTEVTSGLSQGLRMSWDQAGNDTFYSNGTDKGYIRLGVRYDWPVQEYQGSEADLQFATTIPAASHIAFMDGGKVLLAVGNAIFQNHEAYRYGLFSPGVGNVASFLNDVTMIAAVSNGFYASDGSKTSFFRKTEEWYQYHQEPIEDDGALEHSLAHDKVKLRKIDLDMPGFGRVWASHAGICLGADDGQCLNLTESKVDYPSGYTSGSCLIKKDNMLIHTAA